MTYSSPESLRITKARQRARVLAEERARREQQIAKTLSKPLEAQGEIVKHIITAEYLKAGSLAAYQCIRAHFLMLSHVSVVLPPERKAVGYLFAVISNELEH